MEKAYLQFLVNMSLFPAENPMQYVRFSLPVVCTCNNTFIEAFVKTITLRL